MRSGGRWRCGAVVIVAAMLLTGCWGKDKKERRAGEPMLLVGGTAKVEKVTPELFSATAKTNEGRRTLYWDNRTLFFRKGEPVKGEVTVQVGDKFEYRGMEAYDEIYLTRVNFEN